MAKPRFTDEQIAEILQQSKEGRLIRSYVNTINLALARCGAGKNSTLTASEAN